MSICVVGTYTHRWFEIADAGNTINDNRRPMERYGGDTSFHQHPIKIESEIRIWKLPDNRTALFLLSFLLFFCRLVVPYPSYISKRSGIVESCSMSSWQFHRVEQRQNGRTADRRLHLYGFGVMIRSTVPCATSRWAYLWPTKQHRDGHVHRLAFDPLPTPFYGCLYQTD